jgi:hypothetical protein
MTNKMGEEAGVVVDHSDRYRDDSGTLAFEDLTRARLVVGLKAAALPRSYKAVGFDSASFGHIPQDGSN